MASSQTIGFTLGVADQVASSLWRDIVGATVTQPQFLALCELAHAGETSQLELAERVGIDKVTIAPVVKRLDALGWISRSKDSRDARRAVIALAPEGRVILEELIPLAGRISDAFIAPLTATEAALVVQSLVLMAQVGAAGRIPLASTPEPRPADYPWFFVRIARRSYRRIWRERVGELISPSQFVLMSAIAAAPGTDLRTAAEAASVEETTALRMVMRSIRLHLLRDQRDPQQFRRAFLHPTDEGRAQLARIGVALPAIQAALCEAIPHRTLPECNRLLRRLARLPPTE